MPTVEIICKFCGKQAIKYHSPRAPKTRFCSPTCRNKARIMKDIECPICGKMFKPIMYETRKKVCSQKCGTVAISSFANTIEEFNTTVDYVVSNYADKGAKFISKELNIPVSIIRDMAYRNNLTQKESTKKQNQYRIVSDYMSSNNPMKEQEVVDKVKKFWNRPENRKRQLRHMARLRQKQQKKKPTKLEDKAKKILSKLKIEFTSYYIIKDKFVVDFYFPPKLIIQVDGEYWHGHPRFEPLTERQIKQRRRDMAQDKYLTTCGYVVERIWERDVNLDRFRNILQKNGIV